MINKIKPHLTLRARLTLSVVAVLSSICLCITLYMLLSARIYFTKIAVEVPMQKLVMSQIPESAAVTSEAIDFEASAIPLDSISASVITATNTIPVVYDSRRAFSSQSVLVMLGAIFVGAILTYVLTGKSLRPLNELNRATKSVGGKNLSERVPPTSIPDEVGQLSQSFNVMMDRLEESFTIQKRFSGNAAHELKTPIATMKTSLQVLMMDDEPSYQDYAEYAKITEDCINRMVCTIESLIQLTNESCELRDNVEVYGLLEMTIEELSTKISEKEIQTNISGESVSITACEPLIHRVFSNILENAIKYNHNKGNIYVNVAKNNLMAEITIRDTGLGIPSEDIGNVFEAFYRADKSRSQDIPGSGLGLAIVKVILDKHNATISIDSDESGTTVKVCIPTCQ